MLLWFCTESPCLYLLTDFAALSVSRSVNLSHFIKDLSDPYALWVFLSFHLYLAYSCCLFLSLSLPLSFFNPSLCSCLGIDPIAGCRGKKIAAEEEGRKKEGKIAWQEKDELPEKRKNDIKSKRGEQRGRKQAGVLKTRWNLMRRGLWNKEKESVYMCACERERERWEKGKMG